MTSKLINSPPGGPHPTRELGYTDVEIFFCRHICPSYGTLLLRSLWSSILPCPFLGDIQSLPRTGTTTELMSEDRRSRHSYLRVTKSVGQTPCNMASESFGYVVPIYKNRPDKNDKEERRLKTIIVIQKNTQIKTDTQRVIRTL